MRAGSRKGLVRTGWARVWSEVDVRERIWVATLVGLVHVGRFSWSVYSIFTSLSNARHVVDIFS